MFAVCWLRTQIVNSTLNNNEMVKIANRAVQKIQGDCGALAPEKAGRDDDAEKQAVAVADFVVDRT